MGEWMIFSNVIDGKKMYIVGRWKDLLLPLHSGNIEYRSEYVDDRALLRELVILLNSFERTST